MMEMILSIEADAVPSIYDNSMSFPGQRLQRCWHLVDAKNQTVGRLASQIAGLLRGKHKPTFRPDRDMGDYVVVVNAEKIHFSGNKWKDKLYRWHTGYPGGLKERPAERMLERNPTKILRKAILGMLKRTNLRHQAMEPRLFLYTGQNHPHAAQLSPGVAPLPAVPKKLHGGWHIVPPTFYAHPKSYQEGAAAAAAAFAMKK